MTYVFTRTDTRVIMGLLKMMHRPDIFRLCGEYLLPRAREGGRVHDDRIYGGNARARAVILMHLDC